MKKIKQLGALLGFLFLTQFAFSQGGSTFSNPMVIGSLPSVTVGDSTCGYGDNYTTADIACTGSYMNGDEKIYSFTPSSNIASFNVEMTNISDSYSGIYITDDSTTSGNCIGNVGSSGTSTRGVYGVSLVSGTTYYIIVSTWATPQCISSFDINMYTISCPAPSALGATNISYDSVAVSWTENGTGTDWIIEYDTNGFTLGTGTTMLSSTNPDTISGLAPLTDYSYYVRTFCAAGDSSLWVGPFNFTTLATCPAPSALAVTNLAPTAADLGWTESGSATAWDIEWDTAGFTATGTPTITGTTTNPHSLTGLTANTSYEFYVRSSCSATDSSTWVGPFSFATPCNAFSIPYTEGFETGYTDQNDVAGCLIQESVAGLASWVANSSLTSYNRTPRTGSFNAYVRYGNEDWIFIPVNLVGGTSYTAEVYARQDGSSTSNSNVMIAYGTMATAAGMTNTVVAPMGIDATYQSITGAFTPATSGVYYVGIKGYMNSSPWYISIDDISVTVSPACLPPSLGVVTNLTATSADLGWTENGTATNWDIEWDTTGFTQGTGNMVTGTTTNPHSISGLAAETTYQFYVSADCGATSSTWSGPYSFTTPCATITPQYVQPFNTFLPSACWEQAGSGTPATGPSGFGSSSWGQSGFPGTGTGGTRINLYSTGKEEWILSPLFDLSAGGYELKIEPLVAAYSGGGAINMGSDDTVQVLISNDAGATWIAVHTWDSTNSPGNSAAFNFVNLTAYTSATTQFAIWATEGSVNDPEDYYFYLGSFEVRTIPTCIEPDTLMVSNPTTVGADLYWSEMGTATTWDVEIVATGVAPTGTPTNAGLTSDSVTITGLMSSTTYDYYVRAYCSAADQSYWSGPQTFTTACAAVSSFYQDFDGVTAPAMPNCWGNLVFSTSTSAYVQTYNSATNANSGTNSVRFYNVNDLNPTWMLVSPELTNLSSGTHQTVFYAKSADSYDIIVGTMSDPNDTATFTAYDTITATPNYAEYIVSFAGYTGTDDYIAYRSVHTATYDYVYMDDISWDSIPSCPKPSLLNVSNISANSANLVWAENGSANTWHIEWDTTGFTPSTGTTVSTTTNPHTLSGLTASTSYEYYVRSYCTAGDSSVWVGPFSFTTDCNAMTAPWIEEFATATISSCWTTGGNTTWEYGNPTTTPSGFGAYGAATVTDPSTGGAGTFIGMDGSDNSGSDVSYLITPAVDVSGLTIPYASYLIFSNNTNDAALNKVIVDVYDGANWVLLDSIQANLGTSFVKYGTDLSSLTITGPIKLRFTISASSTGSAYYNDIFIDDIEIKDMPVIATAVVDNNVTCFGGADGGATASAAGGTSPYTYAWSNSANTASVTGVMAGTYTVTVLDATGDSSLASVTITEAVAISVSLGNDTSVCDAATITLDAGTFASYLWDDASTAQTRMTVSTLGAVDYSVEVTDANGCTANDTITVTGFAPAVVSLGNDTSVCDAATLTLDAGTFTSYLWDDASTAQTRMTVSTLGAVDYSVEVTDANGCTANDTISVTGIAPVVVSLGNDTVVCDAATLTLDAGTFASYVWDDATTMQTRMTVSTVGAVDYSVEVTDANGCTGNDTISVTGMAAVTVDLGNDTSVCNGASLTLDAGAGYATYLWNDASTMQTLVAATATAGSVDYSVEVADAIGCSATDTVNVTVYAAVTTSISGGADLCAYETATLDAGAGFASYVWNTTETMQTINVDAATLTAGSQTFMVTVTDVNGCSGDATTSFDVFAPVMVDLGSDTSIIWFGADTSYVVDAGAGFTSYLWHDATTAQTNTITLANAGNVSVVVEDANGCLGSDTIVVDFILSVPTLEVSSIKMYPNPAVDQLNIEITNFNNVNEFNVTILNVVGEVVYTKQLNASGNSYKGLVDVSSFATGTYFVQFEANGQRSVRQFVIK